MSGKQTDEIKNTPRPTLDFLEHRGLVVRTTNGAGEHVFAFTEAGEKWLMEGVE